MTTGFVSFPLVLKETGTVLVLYVVLSGSFMVRLSVYVVLPVRTVQSALTVNSSLMSHS